MKRIVILGPESTGKSTLCQQLAYHFKTLWCPEYARQYLKAKEGPYTYHDLLNIAQGQIALEDEYASKVLSIDDAAVPDSFGKKSASQTEPLLFIDTEMTVMKVWSEFVFGKCHPYILEQLILRNYDLYLLCDVDLPWVYDELRECPDFAVRQNLYNIYKQSLADRKLEWTNIHGNFESRLQIAISAVDTLLNKKPPS